MKTCVGCKLTMDLTMFSRNKRKRDGLDSYCKKCMAAFSAANYRKNAAKRRQQNIEWLAANPGKNAEYSLKWRMENPGAQSLCQRSYYVRNRETLLAQDKARRESRIDEFLQRERESYARNKESSLAKDKRWREANKPVVAAYAAKRRAVIRQRTPTWMGESDFDQILNFYEVAAVASDVLGVPHHVDHIVPLRGRIVSGLHVPWNLQILTATANLSKNNRLWPDMP